jgi:dual specificity protein kinase YAK1
MDQEFWPTYQENPASTSRQSRYAPQSIPSQGSIHRDPASGPLSPQDHYITSPMTSRPATGQPPQHLPRGDMNYSDRDGDINMEDADPYKPKHVSLQLSHASHQRMPSNVQQEESAAARRYSPMNLSPSSPFTPATAQAQTQYASYTPQSSNRTSPTRSSYAGPPNSYYASPPSM